MRSAIARAISCAQVKLTVRRSVRKTTVKSHTVPLLVKLVRAHTFMLVDLQAIATKTPAVRCLSSTIDTIPYGTGLEAYHVSAFAYIRTLALVHSALRLRC